MVVQHNLTAMNSNRMLGITTGTQAKSTEKLSSGYKINRAADDAAGLSISEKMRKQIRGLTQASLNAEDGISAVQTAEGALNEVQDMLQRANELAVKAANGTMSENDRNYIQDEIDQLMTEIDRVSTTTKFNETYLLKGDAEGAKEYAYSYISTAAGVGAANNVTLYDENGAEVTSVAEGTIAEAVASGNYFTSVKADTSTALAQNATGVGVSFSGGVWTVTEDLYLADGTKITADNASTYFTAGGAVKNANEVYTGLEGDTAATDASFAEVAATTAKLYDDQGAEITADKLADYFDENGNLTGTVYADNAQQTQVTTTDIDDYVSSKEKAVALTLSLHVGADSTDDNQISVDIEAMSADGLGLLTGEKADGTKALLVNGSDDTNARAAIDTIAAALQQVSTQRSALGAVQNRLEHTIANLDNVVENTTAAESQIRDTDMATEMVKYSNNNILAQAGQAMLAQANQANQGVLSLLG